MTVYKTLSKNRQTGLSAFSIAFLAITASHNVSADLNENIENALKFGQKDAKYGQVKFDLRYRYENANTEGTTNKTANADTVRLRIGYLTPKFAGFQAYTEYEGNQDIFNNNYNSTRNGKGKYDVIADPQQHELNQFWFTYTGLADTEFKVGRQRIKIDNDRFIGNVGWRQMEQTFDAVTVTNKSLANTTFKAGYIINTRDIFSRENDMNTQFVNLAYDFKNIGKLTGYTYLIDYQESHLQNSRSNQTYGFRFNGAYKIDDTFKALYTAEYAWQKDFADNPFSYEVDYINVMGGLSAYGFTLKAAMEQLGGQDGKGFDTPLATLHAFQGWADVFLLPSLATANGIRDTQVSLGAKLEDIEMLKGVEILKGTKVMGVYHNFDDDTGNTDYGQEFDLVVVKKFGKHYSILGKYAYYDAENYGVDTQKIWIQGGIHF
ncbi:MAG: alginate export family protein [Methylococcales bacterium]|nr:alginate export family protein [Methylococcales bacterium]